MTDAGWYDALEADLASQGAHILQARAITLTHLSDEIDARNSVFPKAKLAIDGEYENRILEGESLEDIEFALREDLRNGRPLAQRAGRTLIGPHRSDLCVTHIAKSMPAADCSTGEQKALLIGLMLSLETQVFMTGTDASLFKAFNGRAQSFEVCDGAVRTEADA